MAIDGDGYPTIMNDDTPTTDPVIDLTDGFVIDEVDSPYSAAEHVLAAAA